MRHVGQLNAYPGMGILTFEIINRYGFLNPLVACFVVLLSARHVSGVNHLRNVILLLDAYLSARTTDPEIMNIGCEGRWSSIKAMENIARGVHACGDSWI